MEALGEVGSDEVFGKDSGCLLIGSHNTSGVDQRLGERPRHVRRCASKPRILCYETGAHLYGDREKPCVICADRVSTRDFESGVMRDGMRADADDTFGGRQESGRGGRREAMNTNGRCENVGELHENEGLRAPVGVEREQRPRIRGSLAVDQQVSQDIRIDDDHASSRSVPATRDGCFDGLDRERPAAKS